MSRSVSYEDSMTVMLALPFQSLPVTVTGVENLVSQRYNVNGVHAILLTLQDEGLHLSRKKQHTRQL